MQSSDSGNSGQVTRPNHLRQIPLELIASGNGRDCYVDPRDPSICIKVPHTERGAKESRREVRYLTLVDRLHGIADSPYIAHFRGLVNTTRGMGWCFDRALNETDGLPAPVLADCLDRHSHASDAARWEAAWSDFRGWLETTPLVVKDLTPSNVCVQETMVGERRFVVIDGIGPSAFLARWIPLRIYARRNNPRYAARRNLTDMEGLIHACERYRERRIEQSMSRRTNDLDVINAPVYLDAP